MEKVQLNSINNFIIDNKFNVCLIFNQIVNNNLYENEYNNLLLIKDQYIVIFNINISDVKFYFKFNSFLLVRLFIDSIIQNMSRSLKDKYTFFYEKKYKDINNTIINAIKSIEIININRLTKNEIEDLNNIKYKLNFDISSLIKKTNIYNIDKISNYIYNILKELKLINIDYNAYIFFENALLIVTPLNNNITYEKNIIHKYIQ